MIFILGKTRTRDKYRIVYTDRQRYELENEFLISKYVSIPRKAALSAALALSERQVSKRKKISIQWTWENLDQNLVSKSSCQRTKIEQKTSRNLIETFE